MTSPSPSVDPARERIAEMTGQKYLDQHDAGLLGAALTAVLDRHRSYESRMFEGEISAGRATPTRPSLLGLE